MQSGRNSGTGTGQNSIIADRILNDMTDGVMTVDLEGRIITFNTAASDILGVKGEEAASRRFGELFLELEGADEFSQAILDAVYESSVSHNRIVPFSNKAKSSILSLTTTFLRAEDGTDQKIGVIAVFTDITELQELQEAEGRHAEELKVKHRELQDAYLKAEQGNLNLQAALKKVQVIRITATVFTILLFLIIGLYAWNRKLISHTSPLSPTQAMQSGTPAVITVTPQSVVTNITLSGNLKALQMLHINSPISGKVGNVMVRYGDVVQKGQPLLSIDLSDAQVKYREAKAAYIKALANYRQVENWPNGNEVARSNRSLAKSKLELENQKKTLEESERLFKKGIIPATEYESAKTQYTNQQMDYQGALEEVRATAEKGNQENRKVARYELENAEARIKQIERDMAAATVVAPVAGIVMKPPASGQSKDGRTLEVGATFQQGEILLAIGDLSGFSVSCKVDEVDVSKIKLGQKVRVSGDAFPGEQMIGTIQSISPQADGSDTSQTPPSFGIRVVIDNVRPELKKHIMVGMSANLEIIIYEKPDALMVPLSSVKDEQGKRYVIKKKAGVPADPGEKVEVTTGYTTQDKVEIVKGLKPGDLIIGGSELPESAAPPGTDAGASGKK